MTRQEREAAAIAATNDIFKGLQFDAFRERLAMLQDVVFSATGYVLAKENNSPTMHIAYTDLVNALAALPYGVLDEKGSDKCAH